MDQTTASKLNHVGMFLIIDCIRRIQFFQFKTTSQSKSTLRNLVKGCICQ